MGHYSPAHNVSRLIRRDRSLALAPASGTSGNMGLLLRRASQMLFNSSHSFRWLPSSQPCVCVLLKLPFPQLINRMGFGRANRAPVGRVPLPCREGYEKGQGHRFLQQDQGENKKNQAHTRISTLNCCYAQLGLGEPSAYFRPKLLSHSIFHRVLQIRENECRIFLICLYFNFCPYDLVTYLLFINSYGCSSLL